MSTQNDHPIQKPVSKGFILRSWTSDRPIFGYLVSAQIIFYSCFICNTNCIALLLISPTKCTAQREGERIAVEKWGKWDNLVQQRLTILVFFLAVRT